MKSADIMGYRELTEHDVARINDIKSLEIAVGAFWNVIVGEEPCDKRWANIARTHFEEGFSALVRSIAQPTNRF